MAPFREFGKRGLPPINAARYQVPSAKPVMAAGAGRSAGLRHAFMGLCLFGLAVGGWMTFMPPGHLATLLSASGITFGGPDFSGDRIGGSATAPVLNFCLTKRMMGLHAAIDITPQMLLMDLKASGTQRRLTRVLGAPPQHAAIETAEIWGQLADCVYRQDAFRLCDIDNRALAVEAANTFMRLTDAVVGQPEATFAAQPGEIQSLTATRDRVAEALRARVTSGVLIGSDFAPFAPVSVRAALNDTRTLRNDCAKTP